MSAEGHPAPFLHVLAPDGTRSLEPVLEALHPYADQTFLETDHEGPGEGDCALLECLERLGGRYHLGLRPAGSGARPLVRRLQGLRWLDRLRVRLSSLDALLRGPEGDFARLAAGAGLRVWAVLPPCPEDPGASIARAQGMGLAGLSFLSGQGAQAPSPAFLEGLRRACARGYAAYLEGCLPLERSPFLDPAPCAADPWACRVDGTGRLWRCPHDREALGSLWEAGLAELWRPPDPPARPDAETAAGPVHLDAGLRPLLQCRIRPEPRGALLIRGRQGLPLSGRGLELARFCDGSRNLETLEDLGGPAALSLIHGLHARGMLRFIQQEESIHE